MIRRRGQGIAGLLALVITATGAGLPMCVSVLARAADDCSMHDPAAGVVAAAHSGGHVSPAHAHGRCHTDESGPGCGTAGGCSTAGAAAPELVSSALGVPTARLTRLPPAGVLFHSHSPPPLSPPPQG